MKMAALLKDCVWAKDGNHRKICKTISKLIFQKTSMKFIETVVCCLLFLRQMSYSLGMGWDLVVVLEWLSNNTDTVDDLLFCLPDIVYLRNRL